MEHVTSKFTLSQRALKRSIAIIILAKDKTSQNCHYKEQDNNPFKKLCSYIFFVVTTLNRRQFNSYLLFLSNKNKGCVFVLALINSRNFNTSM